MRHLITVGFLIAAYAMYIVGSEVGSVILFALGAVSELIFFKRLLSPHKK